MKRIRFLSAAMLVFFMVATVAFAAYHHEGEQDSPNFLATYPDKANTKLDHCALCHTGGESKGVQQGSCQWCHATYGYDGSGNIVDTLNNYGKDYYTNGRTKEAVLAIEGLDSDGDGYTNLAEINAGRFPGDANDDPSKVVAPYKVYSLSDLQALASHTQFIMMNTSRSGDFYAEYTGVPLEDLLKDAGILDSATGITVYSADGWSQTHPLTPLGEPESYPVNGTYPSANYYYDAEATAWCDYSAPSCVGRTNGDPIVNPNGNKAILAYAREGVSLIPGVLTADNKLDGEGPFRVVVPQVVPGPPDQSSKSDNQNVIWPYDSTWDHNAGSCSRTVTFIKVEPLPEGTTDINVYEDGWRYVDNNQIIIYGAIQGTSAETVDGGRYIYSHMWAKSVLNTANGPIVLKWSPGGTSTSATGDVTVWGYFYADPSDSPYGASDNPEVFVKFFNAANGWRNIVFNHVTVDPVDVYSAWKYLGTAGKEGQINLQGRVQEHTYADQ